jgi:hypothetical protein
MTSDTSGAGTDCPSGSEQLSSFQVFCGVRVNLLFSLVIGFTTTYAVSVYHHQRCEFESSSWRGVLDTTLCDKDCQCLTLVGGFLRVL